PGIYIDAKPIRQWHDAPALVQQLLDKGAMRSVVVLNFGTNAGFQDPASEVALRDILAKLGPQRRVVLVNTVGVSKWVPNANATLQLISSQFPNTIVADWYTKAHEKPGLLHTDQTHPNVEGIKVYAEVIAEAMAKLGPG
ncbi:MAG: acyltransferase, partial [Pyrinomonadaceae bacterium]